MAESTLPEYSIEQVKENDGVNGRKLWVIINGYVHDLTDFKHPGGREALLDDFGEDRGEDFNSIHSAQAKKDSIKYRVGKLKTEEKAKNDKAANSKPNSSNSNAEQEQVQRSVWGPILIIVACYFIFFKFNLLGIFTKPSHQQN